MNKAMLCGRATAEPEVTYTKGNEPMAIAKYTLAVDRMKKGEADFIRITAFGKNAEFIQKYVHKGMKMIVEGRIQTGSYEDKDGKKVYTTDVIVEHQEFAESKKNSEGQGDADGFMNVPEGVDEDLPFGNVAR